MGPQRKKYESNEVWQPITSRQRAKIAALETDIQESISQVNSLLSIFFTTALPIGLGIAIRVIESDSLLKLIYRKRQGTLRNDLNLYFKNNREILKKKYEEASDSLIEIIFALEENIKESIISNQIFISDKTSTLNYILDHIEKLTTDRPHFASVLTTAKKLCIKFLDFPSMIRGETKNYHFDNLNPDTYSIKYLFKFAEEQLADTHSTMKDENFQAFDQMLEKHSQAFFVAQVFFTLPFQYLLINPLLQKIFPHGIGQAPYKFRRPMSKIDADNYIRKLETHQKIVGAAGHRNIKLARYTSAVILPLALYLLNGADELSPELLIFAISLAATGLNNIIKDAWDFYNGYVFQNRIATNEALLGIALEGNSFTFHSDLHKRNRLELSAFIISFEEKNTPPEGGLSSYHYLNIFKNVLMSQLDVPVQTDDDSSIVIPANFKISEVQARKINALLKEGVARKITIIALHKQMKGFLNSLSLDPSNLLYMQNITNEGLPHAKIEFYLPLKNKKLITELTGILSSDSNQVTTLDNMTGVSFVMECNSRIDRVNLENICSAIRENLNHLVERKNDDNQRSRYKHHKENKLTVAPAPKPLETSSTSLPRRLVEWPSGAVYNSEDKKPSIYPLSKGRYRDYRSLLLNVHHFVRNGLPPDSIDAKTYQAINAATEKATLVPPFGKQGFKFSEDLVIDQDGKRFKSFLKLKFLGVAGDTRAYTKSEKNKKGEVLHTISAISFRAHKRR